MRTAAIVHFEIAADRCARLARSNRRSATIAVHVINRWPNSAGTIEGCARHFSGKS
jgi:hypothetical protein